MTKIRLFGVGIDNLTLVDALENALLPQNAPALVLTPNALMLEAARRDPSLCILLNRATLSLPDGAGVLWAARRRGTPLKERIAGIDFGHALLTRAAEEGLRVFLLGGKEGVAARAAEALQKELPTLCICGTHHGYFDPHGEENRRVLTKIRESRPEILLVCLGFPIQERWAVENAAQLLGIKVIACLGGSLDIWAKDVHRAPCLIQKCGMEWAWRMLCQPRRLCQIPTLCSFVLHHRSHRSNLSQK